MQTEPGHGKSDGVVCGQRPHPRTAASKDFDTFEEDIQEAGARCPHADTVAANTVDDFEEVFEDAGAQCPRSQTAVMKVSDAFEENFEETGAQCPHLQFAAAEGSDSVQEHAERALIAEALALEAASDIFTFILSSMGSVGDCEVTSG